MGRRASAGYLCKPGWCADWQTSRWPWQGFRCKPFDLSCLGHHGPRELQAIPSRRERFVPWPPLLWSARKSRDWRALFFPDLRTLKEGSTAIKREKEKHLRRRLPLHCLPFFSTELLIAHPLASPAPPFPPAGAAGSLPCLHSSLRSRLWSSATSTIFFLLLATSSLLISFVHCCCFWLLIIISALTEQQLGDHAETNSFSSFHHHLCNCSKVSCRFTHVLSSRRAPSLSLPL